jgi:XTP/dITP diphosphohydrolase
VIDLVLATSNPGKLKELRALSAHVTGLNLILAPEGFDPEETGETFLDNAIIKATEAARQTGLIAAADDSGICVDALDGRPGVKSARYAPGTDRDRRLKLLEEMSQVEESSRGAAFVCAMAVVDNQGRLLFSCEEKWPGVLAAAERGENGFGYDPIFCPHDSPIKGQTSAEISAEVKNQLSHRAQAWQKVLNYLVEAQSAL